MCIPTLPKFGVRCKEIQTVHTFPGNARAEPLLLHPLLSTQRDLTFPYAEVEWMSKGGGRLWSSSEHSFTHTPSPHPSQAGCSKIAPKRTGLGMLQKAGYFIQLTSPRIWLVNRCAAWLSTLWPSCLLTNDTTLTTPVSLPRLPSACPFNSVLPVTGPSTEIFSSLRGYLQEIITFCVLRISCLV